MEVTSLRRSALMQQHDTDRRLRDTLGIDEVSLARLRQQFAAGYRGLTRSERLHLVGSGRNGRLQYIHREMGLHLSDAQLAAWWRYLEHDERDIGEMERGLYMIYPRLVQRYCTLLRIDPGFLNMGADPQTTDRWTPGGEPRCHDPGTKGNR